MEKQISKVDSRDLPVYPDYMVLEKEDHFDLLTFVRKEHEGVWYVIGVRMNIDYKADISPDRRASLKQSLCKRFFAEVYKVILFYKINPELAIIDGRGHVMLDVDEDQRSEYERLIPKE